jgi:hypothetical protein
MMNHRMGAPSQQGGVFGGPTRPAPRSDGFGQNMGRSSVKGGIFGSSQQDPFLARLERTEKYEQMGQKNPAVMSKGDAIKMAAVNNGPITLENWADRSKKIGHLALENEAREAVIKEKIARDERAKNSGEISQMQARQQRMVGGQGEAIDREMKQQQQQMQMQQRQQMQMQAQQQQHMPRHQMPQQQQMPRHASEFVPTNEFRGQQPGMVFKAGEQGVGYYKDRTVAAAGQERMSTKVVAPPGGVSSAGSIIFGGGDSPRGARGRKPSPRRNGSPARMQAGHAMPTHHAAGGYARRQVY